MMRFVQFYNRHRGELSEKLGSEGVLPLDGRLGLERRREAAERQASRLKGVAPCIAAYRIFAGRTYRDSRPISPLFSLESA